MLKCKSSSLEREKVLRDKYQTKEIIIFEINVKIKNENLITNKNKNLKICLLGKPTYPKNF